MSEQQSKADDNVEQISKEYVEQKAEEMGVTLNGEVRGWHVADYKIALDNLEVLQTAYQKTHEMLNEVPDDEWKTVEAGRVSHSMPQIVRRIEQLDGEAGLWVSVGIRWDKEGNRVRCDVELCEEEDSYRMDVHTGFTLPWAELINEDGCVNEKLLFEEYFQSKLNSDYQNISSSKRDLEKSIRKEKQEPRIKLDFPN